MADENIVIEVTDKVAPSIANKINAIGDAAKTAHPFVEKLKTALKSIDTSALTNLQKALDANTTAMLKQQLQSQKLATEQMKTATAATRVAAAQSQAATAAANLATAQGKAAAQAANVAAAQDRAAVAAMRLADAQSRAAAKIKAESDKAAAAQLKATQDAALAAANAATAAARLAAGHKTASAAADKYTMSAKQQAAAMRGVPAQITDIVVSLQGGQKPLTVLLQQGGQLKDMFGGIVPAMRALGAGLLAMVNPVTILIAAFVAFGVVVGMVESRMRVINGLVAQFVATGRNDIDGTFIVKLRNELATLPGVSKSAADAVVKAFADVRSVGAAQLVPASKLVADLGTALGIDVPKAAEKFAKALDDPLKGAIELDKELGFLTVSQFKQIDSLMKAGKTAQAQKILIDALSGAIGGLTKDAMTPMQKATDDLGNAWNRFTGELNNSGPVKTATDALIGLIGLITRLLDKLTELQQWTPPDWVKKVWDIGGKAINPLSNITDLLASEGKKSSPITGTPIAPRKRTAEQLLPTDRKLVAAGIKKDAGAGAAESRAAALAKLNAQLDNEFKLMNMLGPEREKQQKWDAIEETMIGKKIKLTDQESASIKAKIAHIIDNADVAKAMGRIYDEVKGPQLEWNATITASDKLLKEGKITQEEYNRVMLKGEEAISNIKDPLREFNKDLNEQLILSRMTSEQAAIESQVMKVRNDMLSKGKELTENETDAIRAKLKAIQESNIAQQAENSLLAESVLKRRDFSAQLDAINKLKNDPKSGFTSGDSAESTTNILKSMGIDPTGMQIAADANVAVMTRMYDQIAELQQKGLINEADASNARMQIWMNEQSQRLASMQTFFGGLASLQTSSNRKLAAIGKAAAITNAVIDTYKSATGAYAAMSSIPYVGPALGAAAAAAAIAAGMANVQAIRSQGTGFKDGGWTGGMARNEVAGVVHGQEVVMSAPAVDRIGRANLEAMNAGRTPPSAAAAAGTPTGGTQGGNVRVVNVVDPAMLGDYLATPEGEQLFVNTIRKNADSIRSTIQNG